MCGKTVGKVEQCVHGQLVVLEKVVPHVAGDGGYAAVVVGEVVQAIGFEPDAGVIGRVVQQPVERGTTVSLERTLSDSS